MATVLEVDITEVGNDELKFLCTNYHRLDTVFIF